MFSNDRNVESIAQLVEVLKHYIGLQSEYVKLDVIEKVVRLITALAITLTVILFLLIILIYLSFALAGNGFLHRGRNLPVALHPHPFQTKKMDRETTREIPCSHTSK